MGAVVAETSTSWYCEQEKLLCVVCVQRGLQIQPHGRWDHGFVLVSALVYGRLSPLVVQESLPH
jgi:hypothetical protein